MRMRRFNPLIGPYLVYVAAMTVICMVLVDLVGGIHEAVMAMVPGDGTP